MDAEAIRELFEPVARVALKRMFGGHGIYVDGIIIAIEAYGVIWMKCDAISQPVFEARGLKPFTYAKQGKTYAMSYSELPDTAFDDPDELREWINLAREAAMRAGAKRADAAQRKVRKPKR